MEKGEDEIEIVEVTIDEVEHEARFRELELHYWGLEHGSEPLNQRKLIKTHRWGRRIHQVDPEIQPSESV